MKTIKIAMVVATSALSLSAYAKDVDHPAASQTVVIGEVIEGNFSGLVPVGVSGELSAVGVTGVRATNIGVTGVRATNIGVTGVRATNIGVTGVRATNIGVTGVR